MDTSGLASSLSLAAFLLVFGYLCLAEQSGSPGKASVSSAGSAGSLIITIRLLRLVSVVAVVLSAHSILISQGSPAVGLIAIVACALVATLLVIDRGAAVLSNLYPGIVSRLAVPIHVPLSRLLNLPRSGGSPAPEPGERNDLEQNGKMPNASDPATVVITEEDQAELDARERLMIRSIMRLDESSAREILVPRVDIIAVAAETPLTDVASRMQECGHTRLPVFSETIDNILGVVYSRDLLAFLPKTEKHPPLQEIIRPAFFIPESKRLDELLKELQEKHVQMAIVVDEYGGIEGLVTLEDLLEEIVGEIEDEFSRSLEPRVVPTASGDIVVDARVSLDYLSDLFSTPIGNEDVDTIGGLVYSSLGKMPQVGDEVLHNGLRIEVVSLLGRRIRKLKLSRTEVKET